MQRIEPIVYHVVLQTMMVFSISFLPLKVEKYVKIGSTGVWSQFFGNSTWNSCYLIDVSLYTYGGSS